MHAVDVYCYLECRELVALLLEASDDLAHKVALDAVRLDHDVSALHGAAKDIRNGHTHTDTHTSTSTRVKRQAEKVRLYLTDRPYTKSHYNNGLMTM